MTDRERWQTSTDPAWMLDALGDKHAIRRIVMDSFLTDSEIDLINSSSLNRGTPFLIRGVSSGMLSVARYYGGAKYNGASYTYHPPTDELIRDEDSEV